MIKELMRRNWSIQIDHIYHEVNSVTDFLTTYALKLPVEIYIF